MATREICDTDAKCVCGGPLIHFEWVGEAPPLEVPRQGYECKNPECLRVFNRHFDEVVVNRG